METAILDWLGAVGEGAFLWSAVGFVIVNGVAGAAILTTRDRTLVNRWTGRVLAANLVLAGTGLGIPLITTASRAVVAAILPTPGSSRIPMPMQEPAPTRAPAPATELTRE